MGFYGSLINCSQYAIPATVVSAKNSLNQTYSCIVTEKLKVTLGQELIVQNTVSEFELVPLKFPQLNLVTDCRWQHGFLGRNEAGITIVLSYTNKKTILGVEQVINRTSQHMKIV